MGVAGTVTKIFGMFDKLDDIIYEPIKLVCDVFRQPLKKDDLRNDLKKEKEEQELKKQLEEFEADLEIGKKKREMELSVEERKLNEEINQMIKDSDLARSEKMTALEAKYRKVMSEAAIELANIVCNIEVDARKRILDLYAEKKKQYLEIQIKYEDNVHRNVAKMKELFPDHSGDTMIMEFMLKSIDQIADESMRFTEMLNEDWKNIRGLIDYTIKSTSDIASKYLNPSTINEPAISGKEALSLEKKS